MKHTGNCRVCGIPYSRERPLRGTTCSFKCRGIMRRKSVGKTCPTCKKNFNTRPSHKSSYCSIVCFNRRSRRPKADMTRTCERCGNWYIRSPGQVKRKFCSINCARNAAPMVDKICPRCNKPFSHRRRRFCSVNCSTRHTNEEKKRINIAQGFWHNQREAKSKLLTQDPACRVCGWKKIPEVLELHHKDRNRRNAHKSNLVLLCPTCHTIEHWQTGTGQFKNNRGLNDAAARQVTGGHRRRRS
jgi:hypothetical protein